MRKLWLITTDHLEDELWFRDEEDFKVAMNYIAIQAARNRKVVVLVFILMSNHVHILVLCEEKREAEEFLLGFRHRYSIYMNRKWGRKEFLRRNGYDIEEIPFEEESPERAIAYVQMNCVAAKICSHPSQYPWGTGNCFFNQTNPTGTRLGDMSARARMRLLHTFEDDLPEDWRVCENGYILPQEYVDIETVENLFRNPSRMNYFYNTSSKAKKRIETSEGKMPAFRDQVILNALPDLCRSMFGRDSFDALSPEDKTEFMRQIRFRFSADANQIARVCGVTYADAARMLDSV
ncbi:MAG: transposase [Bacteroidales bacterium]|nr:transposase [Bacteroidales bacterium]